MKRLSSIFRRKSSEPIKATMGGEGETVKEKPDNGREFVLKTIEDGKGPFDEAWNNQAARSAKFDDFDRIITLGCGAFGRVMLVQHKENSNYYAMKILAKKAVVELRQVEHTINEKRILASCTFPYLVAMDFCIKDNSNLYMILELVSGGEMWSNLYEEGGVGKYDEPRGKLYAAQVIMALQYLHANSLVYRDLKPENLLMDGQGYVKVTDFGFAKRVDMRTYTMCGTPEYLAPEIIKGKGYSVVVDWWSCGVLIYEMCAGEAPFQDDNPMKLFGLITAAKFECPDHFSPELQDLVKNMLEKDITARFGNMHNGVKDIMYHAWFDDVDWEALYNKKIPAPWVPEISDPTDTSHFDKQEEEPVEISDNMEFEKEFAEF